MSGYHLEPGVSPFPKGRVEKRDSCPVFRPTARLVIVPAPHPSGICLPSTPGTPYGEGVGAVWQSQSGALELGYCLVIAS